MWGFSSNQLKACIKQSLASSKKKNNSVSRLSWDSNCKSSLGFQPAGLDLLNHHNHLRGKLLNFSLSPLSLSLSLPLLRKSWVMQTQWKEKINGPILEFTFHFWVYWHDIKLDSFKYLQNSLAVQDNILSLHIKFLNQNWAG